MFNRLIGIFKLDKTVFDEIEHDPHATLQAAVVVATVSLLSSLGSGVYASIRSHSFFTGFLVTLVWYFFGWVLWALICLFLVSYILGVKCRL
jgi:ABC-type dipeptide/oligopeptide/nickel transport system permease component